MSGDVQASDVAEDLTAAAMWGNLKFLESLIQYGADPNLLNSQGNTALHVAVYYGELECASVLLSYKADVNAVGNEGKTPLHKAVSGVCVQEPGAKFPTEEKIHENQMDIVRLLFSHGADLLARDKDGATPRDLALQCDFYDCADLIDELQKIFEAEEKRLTKKKNMKDIYAACEAGDVARMKELLPSVPEAAVGFPFDGDSLFMCAASKGHLSVVLFLLEQNVQPYPSPAMDYTPLHVASQAGHADVASCLINQLPYLLAIDDIEDGTSLHMAARQGHMDVVRVLLQAAASQGFLRMSTEQKDVHEILESSLDYMLDILATTFTEGRTALHEATLNGHVEVVNLLLEFMRKYLVSPPPPPPSPSASPQHPELHLSPRSTSQGSRALNAVPGVDKMTLKGRTAFHEAARLGNFEVMESLLAAGADINAHIRPSLDQTVNTDLTALVQACLMDSPEIVRFLLQHGATDARLKALSRSLRVQHREVAGLILCYNGNVTAIVEDPKVRAAKRKGKPKPSEQDVKVVTLLNVAWNSKKLPYFCKEWLDMALCEMPKSPNQTYAISQLDISSNDLKKIPTEIFCLPSLTELNISRNSLEALPEGDDGCTRWQSHKLATVDMSRNSLRALPSQLFTLSEISDINASRNKISSVPGSVWSATKLRKLYVNYNELSSFPSPVDASGMEQGSPMINSAAGNSLPESGYVSSQPFSDSLQESGEMDGEGKEEGDTVEESIHRTLGLNFKSSSGLRTQSIKPISNTQKSSKFVRRRFENFHDSSLVTDDLDELETPFGEGLAEEENGLMLEVLDMSYNSLSYVPQGLNCLATKLQKLNISHNCVKTLGCIGDYPCNIEMLDASHNKLHTAIAYTPSRDLSSPSCVHKQLLSSNSAEAAASPKPCSHRAHKSLSKLATLKLNSNYLVDVQLFRLIGKSSSSFPDLSISLEESTAVKKGRTTSVGDPFALVVSPTVSHHSSHPFSLAREDLNKSIARGVTTSTRLPTSHNISRKTESTRSSVGGDSSGSGHSSGEGSSSGGNATSMLISPLFPQLSTLELAHNQLKSVPSNLHLLTSLSCLNISHNPAITTLPLELSNLEHLWNLEYEGLPLTSPPVEDLDKFRLAYDKLLYMRSLLHDAKPNESMKLMLVGLQRMGKTTLLQKLREVNEVSDTSHTTFNQRVTGEASVSPAASSNPRRGRTTEPLSTVGVDLGVWRYRKDLEPDVQRTRKKGSKPMRSVTFYTWDFGGQEEYYVTHQCFLSTRSLYLMVWDVTLGEEGIQSLGPWLHNIQARAPGSPVVIVGTHCDKIRGEEREKRKVELNRVIYEKYLVGRGPQQLRELGLPRILDVMYVGCPPGGGRGEGVAELRKALYSIAFSLTVLRSGHVGGGGKNKLLEQPIPASFLLLEERVRQLVVECGKEAAPPVLREMVFRECTKDIIANPRELNQAVTFLHENGVMLHYATPALNHLYFVDPQWLCDMLAHIITVPEVNNFIQRYQGKEAGILRTSVLAQVFKGDVFPQAYRQEYIELLGKFEVAMMLDRERLLVPSMLNAQPSFTLHSFPTTFPRPPLPHILSTCPDSAKLFDGETSHSPSSPASPTLLPCDPLSTISLLSEELCHTGLLLRRFYFMTYVPSGFWPRLLSRFLTSTSFVSVVLRALGCEPDHIQKEALRVVSGETSGAIGLEWSYWNTGIELWYKGLSLLRVCEILPNYTFVDCKPSPSIYEQTCREPLDPTSDTTNLSFEINGSWVPVDLSPTRGVEVVVSDVVCPVLLRQEAVSSPQCERMWLGAALMSQAVDYLDTLLEDWYPGLGAREGNKTIHSIPYVNRIIPCPYCVNKSSVFDKEKGKELEASSEYTLTSSTHSPNPPSSSYFSVSSSLPTSFPSHAKRTLFNASESDSADHVLSEEQWKPEEPDSEQFAHRETLADMHRIQSKERNPEDGYLAMAFPLEGGEDDSGLVLASRFGFMLETCILASRCGEDLVCPAHPQHPLPVHDLAPDVVFADLPSQYILDPECVDKGEYVNHGTFGDIYHGKVYPTASATDDEGLEVAIKIDRLDSRKYTQETATKAYIEVRGEVSILINLKHEHIIEFVGVVLRPLCFILEWAPLGGLSSMLQKYRKVDARVGPLTLQKTAYQVALGLEYLHRQGIVYYDLKSPNVLVFQFPSPQQSLHCTTSSSSSSVSLLLHQDEGPVLVKIADLGISRRMTPGGVMGFKGSPGFMAPEILKYVGTEACTEKVDIFSFGMFLYEMVSLYFPFEKQNLMGSQIEKLVVEGERPPLQNRELNNPILFLDVMRWCWHQDFRFRPMASDLIHSLESPSLPRLLDAISLHDNAEITSACLSTLPVEIVSPTAGPEEKAASSAAAQPPHVARGDLQEELWLCTFERGSVRGSTGGSRAVVVNFRGKASFCTESFEVYDCDSEITAMCSVNDTMWLGSLKGYIFIYDAVSKQFLIRRQIAVVPGQGIVSIHHLRSVRQVAVTRRDGYVLLFNECIQELTLPDDSHYDNRVNSTQLPVRAVLKTPETLPILCGVLVPQADTDSKHLLWCGTTHDQVLVYDLYLSRVEYCRRRCCRPLNEASAMDKIVQVVKMEDQIEEGVVCVWALSQPSQVLYRWRTDTEELVQTVSCSTLHPDPVTSMYVLGTCLQLCLQNGGILMVQCPIPSSPSPSPSSPPSSHDCVNLRGHVGSVFTLLTVGARTLPRHWLPTIIGRSNVIDYYKDLLSEEDITDIHSSMVGQQTRLLVSIGRGFHGVADRLVEPLMTPHDREDNFILLWCT